MQVCSPAFTAALHGHVAAAVEATLPLVVGNYDAASEERRERSQVRARAPHTPWALLSGRPVFCPFDPDAAFEPRRSSSVQHLFSPLPHPYVTRL